MPNLVFVRRCVIRLEPIVAGIDDPTPYGVLACDGPGVAMASREILGDEAVEVLLAFLLSSSGEVVAYHEVARGGVMSVSCCVADVLRAAVMAGCARVAIAHNHPVGLPQPSEQDVEFTRAVAAGCELLGLHFLDHFLVAAGRATSFRENGWL